MHILLTYLPLAAVAITLGSVLVRHERRYAELEQKIARLETKMDPFWDLIRRNLGALWPPGENPDQALIAKLSCGTLTFVEARELERQLVNHLNARDTSQPLSVLFTLWVLNGEKEKILQGKTD